MGVKRSFFIIINPKSGQSKGVKIWHKIEAELRQHFAIDFAFTEYAKHERILAQNAIKKGFKHFIILGGDGTLRNFINGVFNQNEIDTNNIVFGIIPVGTGNDWIKTHQIPKSSKKALQAIIKGNTKRQDVGKIEYTNLKEPAEYFMNIAGVGFDGLVVDIVKSKRTFGRLSYLLGAIKGLLKHHQFAVTVNVDNKNQPFSNCFIIQIGIGKYTGSGMRLTDFNGASDGLFDISIANDFSKLDFIKHLTQVFNGKILNHENVESFKSNQISISFDANHKPFVQVDGEQLKKEDLKISILRNGIAFYC